MIELFLINSLLIFGVKAVFARGMIFGVVGDWLFKKMGGYYDGINEEDVCFICKPFFTCPPCMASTWGSVGFLFAGLSWWYLPLWVVCLSGFNYIVTTLIHK